MTLELSGIHHVAICVDDLDAALAFWVGKIGLTVRDDRPDSLPNPGVWLDLGADQVHLLIGENRAPGTFQHFSVVVDSIAEVEARLAVHDVPVEGHQVVEGYGLQAFVRDPAGNIMELFEQRWPLDDHGEWQR